MVLQNVFNQAGFHLLLKDSSVDIDCMKNTYSFGC